MFEKIFFLVIAVQCIPHTPLILDLRVKVFVEIDTSYVYQVTISVRNQTN